MRITNKIKISPVKHRCFGQHKCGCVVWGGWRINYYSQ